MKTFTDVLVYNNHITGTNPEFVNPVQVVLNFDLNRVAGHAILKVVNGSVKADITLTIEQTLPVCWPALGGAVVDDKFFIKTLSLCANPNIDPNIPPLYDNREAM